MPAAPWRAGGRLSARLPISSSRRRAREPDAEEHEEGEFEEEFEEGEEDEFEGACVGGSRSIQ